MISGGRDAAKVEVLGNLPQARGLPPYLPMGSDEVQYLLLALGQCH